MYYGVSFKRLRTEYHVCGSKINCIQRNTKNCQSHEDISQHDFRSIGTKLEFQVRALNQSGYELENVIRAGLKGNAPNATPIPLGSNMYLQYGDYSCNTSSKPLWEMLLDGTSSDKDKTRRE
uniref:Putative salivary lipocalin n=1 Tax=Ixodes ricinus TaxID=34613 RepID=A0A0K8RBH9_IXORI